MQNREKVGVVVLNWRNASDTIRCVESIQRSSYKPYVVIVVDNASGDGSVERFNTELTDVRLIANDQNTGYAAGNNVGIKMALDLGCKFVWIVNNDAVVAETTLEILMGVMVENAQTGICGGTVLALEDGTSVTYAGAKIDWTLAGRPSHLGGKLKIDEISSAPVATDYINGASILVREDVIRDIGLIPEAYFLYFEETEWCYRATKAGWMCTYVPQALVWHPMGKPTIGGQSLYWYYFTRNRLLFVYRNRREMLTHATADIAWLFTKAAAATLLRQRNIRFAWVIFVSSLQGLWDFHWSMFRRGVPPEGKRA